MAENSGIQWTDHTFNPWWGCTKVSPGCDHCYAETLDKRTGGEHWGAGAERRRTSLQNWNLPRKWNAEAERTGIRPRVFCASMADVFDNEVPDQWRNDLWQLIYETPHLRWMLLTKRIGNASKMLPLGWPSGFDHVGLMISVVNQQEAERDIPKLLDLPAAWHGLSMEPLLGPVDLTALAEYDEGKICHYFDTLRGEVWDFENGVIDGAFEPGKEPKLDWVIVGGESGNNVRPMHPDWARSLRDKCAEAGVPFFFKQWGEWQPHGMGHAYMDKFRECMVVSPDNKRPVGNGHPVYLVGKKAAGRLLDGIEHNAFPKDLT